MMRWLSKAITLLNSFRCGERRHGGTAFTPGLCCQARAPLAIPNENSGHRQRSHDNAHRRDEDSSGQSENAARMHWKLRLNENIRRGALPRHARAKRPSVLPVIVK